MLEYHLFQIGNQEYYCYDETVNGLADEYGGSLSKEQVEYAMKVLHKQIRENHYVHSLDTFSLIYDFMKKENVELAVVTGKGSLLD